MFLIFFSYLSSVSRPEKQERESDIESVDSDEFDALIERFEPDAIDDENAFDDK